MKTNEYADIKKQLESLFIIVKFWEMRFLASFRELDEKIDAAVCKLFVNLPAAD